MATTSLEDVIERECGLAGRGMEIGSFSGDCRSWKWRVESQEAETRISGKVSDVLHLGERTYYVLCCTPPT